MSVRRQRRQFLKWLGAGGAVAALNTASVAAALAAAPPGSFAPAIAANRDPVWLALSRFGFGVTPELYAEVRNIGPYAWLEQQLDYENIDDSALEARLAPYAEVIDENSFVVGKRYRGMRGQVLRQFFGAWLLRSLYSRRQLYERMVHFWSDHFSVYMAKDIVWLLKIDDDRDVIRTHALGRFREILGADAHSPAMLLYLDQIESNHTAPNENYARELMELHTLGVNGGYTEQDVKEVARALTGWSINGRREADRSGFRFRPRLHDDGEKIVLGQVIPAGGGVEDGEMVLDILAQHPSTAQFIATKLARRFVSDFPPQELIDQIAAAYTETDGDIRAMLRVIINSDHFWNAPPKFRRPYEYIVSGLRALGYDYDRTPDQFVRLVIPVLEALGHQPFMWPAPNGYPDVGAYWQSNLLLRWNAALAIAMGVGGQLHPNPEALVAAMEADGVPLELEPVLGWLARYLWGRDWTDEERAITLNFAQQAPEGLEQQIAYGLALLMAAPAHQYK